MPAQLPAFYRVLFLYLDPLMAGFGSIAMLLNPTFFLNAYNPRYTSPPAVETTLLLQSHIGFYASLAFLQVVLLRVRPNDVTVWRILQASTVLIDACQVAVFLYALETQGRLHPLLWRSDEISQIVGNGVLGLIRTAFAL
ncbi:hypothetical protein K431DRAFT_206343, partial [Polychaeton citri CBS 116435]